MSNATDTNRLLTPDMVRLGFATPPPRVSRPRIFACTTGKEKAGKTHWAMRAPGPIAAIAVDVGTREVARKLGGNGKAIYLTSVRSAGNMIESSDTNAASYKKEWTRARDAILAAAANPKIRSLVVDTCGELWELCRLAAFGKLAQVMPQHYGPVNSEFRELWKGIYDDREDLNVVLTHKVKKEYKSGKDGKDAWTGKFERAGFADVPYLVDINLEHTMRFNEEAGVGGLFGVKVLDSRLAPETTVGMVLEGEECDFMYLACACWPDSAPSDWL